jgi:predicted RNase H-like HicB family nuclease
MKEYTLIIGRDEETGVLMASIPELPGCFTTGETLNELESNARKSIQVYIESNMDLRSTTRFLGVHSIKMAHS